jgi:fructokinase
VDINSLKIEKVADTSGARDAFYFGFLYPYAGNYNYINNLKFRITLASLKFQSSGSSSFNPNIRKDFFQYNA